MNSRSFRPLCQPLHSDNPRGSASPSEIDKALKIINRSLRKTKPFGSTKACNRLSIKVRYDPAAVNLKKTNKLKRIHFALKEGLLKGWCRILKKVVSKNSSNLCFGQKTLIS